MQTRRLFICLMLFASATVHRLHADDKIFTFKVEAGMDYLLGYTQYGIGWNFYDTAGTQYSIGYKISQLKFPLNSLGIYANADMTLFDLFRLSLHFDKNLTAAPGKMEDSDWGYWYLLGNSWADSSTLDVFSQSDANLNRFSLEGSFHYILPLESAFSISFGVGFIYQHLYFEVSNLDQWYPSYEQYAAHLDPSYANHYYQSGLVGTYKIDYFIPLAEARVEVKTGDLISIGLLAGFGPIFASDSDDHVLRSRLSTSNSFGLGTRCSLWCRFNFTSWLYAGVNARFLYLHAEGKQVQFQYNDTSEGPAGPLGSVDEKIDSLQFSAGAHVGVSF